MRSQLYVTKYNEYKWKLISAAHKPVSTESVLQELGQDGVAVRNQHFLFSTWNIRQRLHATDEHQLCNVAFSKIIWRRQAGG